MTQGERTERMHEQRLPEPKAPSGQHYAMQERIDAPPQEVAKFLRKPTKERQ